MKLKNKVAVVTGAGRGIGKTIALALAKEGAKVVINDVNFELSQMVASEIKKKNREAIALQSDVSNSIEVTNMVDEIIKKFKKIDILVNNAGIMQSISVEKMTEENWDKMMAINLKGVFLCSKAVMKYMKKQKSGKIINISSLAGKSGGIMVGANYSASKAGVIAFTKSLARELAPYKINVNAVAPGTADTDMAKLFSAEQRRKIIDAIPLGRFANPEDIANAVVFLASNRADYITGATLDVNGGLLMD
ncbi:MAG: 3-oxoacyl-ACP reductase family protein [Candidatus Firestonebacteria bacterium]